MALSILTVFSSISGSVWHIVSFTIFGSSLIILYTSSTIYHLTKSYKKRRIWKSIDHSAIYVLIAGTYTPYCLVTLNGNVGWVLLSIIWSMGIGGIILKIFYAGRFKTISTFIYILMGWLMFFALKPLLANLPLTGFLWLLGGGISYTLGAVFYSVEKISLNHAIFHIFVLIGSISHFISIFFYVL